MPPKISIITIAYNSEKTIEDTIKSVISQSYPNKEYIIIDGKSTDNTLDIVNSYAPHIDCIISEADSGISNAFNKGIAKATGDLIVLINSDDELVPNTLQIVADTWDTKSDIWSGDYVAWNEQTQKCFTIKPSLDFPNPPYFRRAVHQGRFITKKLYNRIGMYDEAIRCPMDLEFLMRAYHNGATFQYIPKTVAKFRLGGVTSLSIFKKKHDYIYMVRKHGGSWLQAHTFFCFLVITQTLKSITNLFNTDLIRSIRYR